MGLLCSCERSAGRSSAEPDVRNTPARTQTLSRAVHWSSQYRLRSLGIRQDDLTKLDSVIQLGYPPSRIDLLSSIDGVHFDQCFAKRLVLQIDGLDMPVINIVDFRTNKIATGRLKDLADIEMLDDPKPKT